MIISHTYSVTIDVPAGISSGQDFGDDLEAASNYFGEARRGSYPDGTTVTLWETREGPYRPGTEVLDRATVTAETKAAARADMNAGLDAIIRKANARSIA